MAEPISIQQLKDASEDAISLAEFINKPENTMIPRRLASDIHSLQYYLEYMKSFAQRSYETYDEMVANVSNLSENVSVFVTNDSDTFKNGIYTYNGTSFIKGEYQPEKAAKDFVEAKLGGLEVFNGKVRSEDVSTSDGSTQDVKNTEFRNELDALPFEGGVLADTFVTATKKTPLAVARTQQDVNADSIGVRDFGQPTGTKVLLSEKYATLALAKEDYPFVTDLTASYDWAVLQAFIKEVESKRHGSAEIVGSFYINKPLTWNGSGTKKIKWDAVLTMDEGGGDDWAITFVNNGSEHTGNMYIACYVTDTYDVTNWAIRSWHHGVKVERVIGADFSGLTIQGRIKGRLFYVSGKTANGNYFKGGNLGGYAGTPIGAFILPVSSKVNSGLHSNINQRTELTLASPIDFDVTESLARIDGKEYLITAHTGNKVTVFPWVNSAAANVEIIYGGILKTDGDNGNALTFGTVRGLWCGNIYSFATAYGVKMEVIGGEFCNSVLQYGHTPESIVGPLEFGLWYTEFNGVDIIDVTAHPKRIPITVNNPTGLYSKNYKSKVTKLNLVNNEGDYVSNQTPTIQINSSQMSGRTNRYIDRSTGKSISTSQYILFGLEPEFRQVSDSATLTLSVYQEALDFGAREMIITHTGTKKSGGVTSTNLACEVPYTFEYSDEANGRALYLRESVVPRRLLIRLEGTVFKVYSLTEHNKAPYENLAVNFGTGLVTVNANTTNRGSGLPAGEAVVQSYKVNQDPYTVSNVDIAYSNTSANVPVVKVRSRKAAAASNWHTVINSGLFSNVTPATAENLEAKLNEIITILKS